MIALSAPWWSVKNFLNRNMCTLPVFPGKIGVKSLPVWKPCCSKGAISAQRTNFAGQNQLKLRQKKTIKDKFVHQLALTFRPK